MEVDEIELYIGKMRQMLEALDKLLPAEQKVVGSAYFELDHALLSLLYLYVWDDAQREHFSASQLEKVYPFDPSKYAKRSG